MLKEFPKLTKDIMIQVTTGFNVDMAALIKSADFIPDCKDYILYTLKRDEKDKNEYYVF